MKNCNRKQLAASAALLVAFVLWTVIVCAADVQPIGPEGSKVGLATLNGAFHSLTGVHMNLYLLTDWLSLILGGIVLGFGCLGLVQWVQRKSLGKVDFSILALGGFYVAVGAAYVLFEILTINYRPVLIEGVLEASYPSSTTMLAMCVVPTAWMQLHARIRKENLRRWVSIALGLFMAFMVLGRLISGVHWCTDIIGGALLSMGLVLAYAAVAFPESGK